MKIPSSRPQRASGFTLIEILIAVVVMTFGLLGLASLLFFTVQNNANSTFRTTATILAQDIADAMRLNVNASKRLNSNLTYDAAGAVVFTPKTGDNPYLNSLGSSVNCFGPSATACNTETNVANRDLFVWQAKVAASLPGGNAIICHDFTPDDGTQFTDAQCSGEADAPMVIKIFWSVRPQDSVTPGANTFQRLSLMVHTIG
jgi:type IV pilus assembly protein PilV